MTRECIECGTTDHLQNHPEYPGDAICLQCLHGWYREELERHTEEIEELEGMLEEAGLNYDKWETS